MSATAQTLLPAGAILIKMPARKARVTKPAVRAVLATLGPHTTQRQIREALGGGSLRDISRIRHELEADGSLATQRASMPADADLAPVLVAAIEDLQQQVGALRLQQAPRMSTAGIEAQLRALANTLADQEKRWSERFAALTKTVAPTEKKQPARKPEETPAQARQIWALEQQLRGIDRHVTGLSERIDADRRERELPAPQAVDEGDGPTLELLQAKVDRVIHTVDAQFGWVRRIESKTDALASPSGSPAADPPPASAAAVAQIRTELRTLRAAGTRQSRATQAQVDLVLAAIAKATVKPKRRRKAPTPVARPSRVAHGAKGRPVAPAARQRASTRSTTTSRPTTKKSPAKAAPRPVKAIRGLAPTKKPKRRTHDIKTKTRLKSTAATAPKAAPKKRPASKVPGRGRRPTDSRSGRQPRTNRTLRKR